MTEVRLHPSLTALSRGSGAVALSRAPGSALSRTSASAMARTSVGVRPVDPQRRGWRAQLGLRPSRRELAAMRDEALVLSDFDRPVTIMVANPKGGVGKTPVSMLLAAAFGTVRGGGVIAWDNNELRGTLPDRSVSLHRRNVHDLLGAIGRVSLPESRFDDLAYLLNHQPHGNFFTLGSAASSGHVITERDFAQIHEVFERHFQVIVVDTGNNEAAANWLAAARCADVLVIPTKWRRDSLISAARMLETLQYASPALLQRTVIAASNGPAEAQPEAKASARAWFGAAYPVVEIPVDPHVAEGGVIDYARLKPATRQAADRLATEVVRRLGTPEIHL